MNLRVLAVCGILVSTGCGSMAKTGRVDESVSPDVSGRSIRRIALLAGSNRGDRQVLVRARERLTQAGVNLIRRPGTWETNADAVKAICVQNPDGTDNVDAVLFVDWDVLTLHHCASGSIATSITGSYAGIDVLVDRLIRYLGVTPPAAEAK